VAIATLVLADRPFASNGGEMAAWWELVIPAGSALIGTLIGAGSQLALRRVRSRHERLIKMYDDRKALYARTEAASENVLDGLRGRPSAGASHEARQVWFDEFLPVYEELEAAARLVRLIGSRQVVCGHRPDDTRGAARHRA
jgi:hypothetical protein